MIYFDNAATTQLNPAVTDAMQLCEQTNYFNANTGYAGGVAAAKQIAAAKQTILQQINGTTGQLIFTSGATAANQMLINFKTRRPNQRLIVTAGDHNSVYVPAKELADRGYDVVTAPLLASGLIDLPRTLDLVTAQTTLLVFSLVNSDTGTYQDAAALTQAVHRKNPNVHIHADAAQAAGKFPIDVAALGVDSLTLCAHKIHGPKGIGALWLRAGITLPAPHGTLNNAGIVGLATALTTFAAPQVPALHDYLVQHLPAGCQINGCNNNPFITNIMLPGVYGETVLNALSNQGTYVGIGSACSAHAKGNRTLAAMGRSPEQQKQVLRISFGMTNTLAEVKTFLDQLSAVLQLLGKH